MDPEKQKALDAVADGREYDVAGQPCRTAADVHRHWPKDKAASVEQPAAKPRRKKKPAPAAKEQPPKPPADHATEGGDVAGG